jgi:hypothetical protein
MSDGSPVDVTMTKDARAHWIKFYNHNAAEQAAATGHMRAAMSKLEAYVARLALIIALVRDAAAGQNSFLKIDDESMANAIALGDWFKNEAGRVYQWFSAGVMQRQVQELIEVIKVKGGKITVRELSKSKGQHGKADEARLALRELERNGCRQDAQRRPRRRRTTERGLRAAPGLLG